MAKPGTYPIQAAIAEAMGNPGPPKLQSFHEPDEFLRRIATLPLIHQPGERWLYHTASDILGVLIARASGQSLGDFMRERIFDPLGMKDTGFHVPAEKISRLALIHVEDAATGKLNPPENGRDPTVVPRGPSGGGRLRGGWICYSILSSVLTVSLTSKEYDS